MFFARPMTMIIAVLLASAAASAAEPESKFFNASDGAKLHYLTLGDQGSWVVLIHGAGDSARRMWFSTGIAEELAKNHRVVAIDCRGHGESRDVPGGGNMAQDVLDLMKTLNIEKAHIHGYSMGGGITGRLLASSPEKFITVGFHGSGVSETDPEAGALARKLDSLATAAASDEARSAGRQRARGAGAGARGARGEGDGQAAARGARGGRGARGARGEADGQAAARGGDGQARGRGGRGPGGGTGAIDLAKLDIPMIFINGSLDGAYARASRALREAKEVKLVVLEGKNHFTAIMVGGPMPQEYITELAKFINEHDPKP